MVKCRRHLTAAIIGGNNWHHWCVRCGTVISHRDAIKDYYRRPSGFCTHQHDWANFWLTVEKCWNSHVSWCKRCGALKHDGAMFEHAGGGISKQPPAIVRPDKDARQKYNIFEGTGIFSREV